MMLLVSLPAQYSVVQVLAECGASVGPGSECVGVLVSR